jgi:hypothetical protein
VGEVGLRATPQVDHRRHQQHHVDQGHTQQEYAAEAPHPQQVPRDEAGAQDHPEPDLARGDDRENHASSLTPPVRGRLAANEGFQVHRSADSTRRRLVARAEVAWRYV